jgi:hypothetical protein
MIRVALLLLLLSGTIRAQEITREDLRKTLEHIQALAQDSERRAIVAEDKTINVQKKLDDANRSLGTLQGDIKTLADDRDKQAANAVYWQQKHKEAVAKLWWWRLWAGGALFLGLGIIAVLILAKFTTWGAKTFGPLIMKVTTGL